MNTTDITTDITRKLTTILIEHLGCNPEEVTPDAYLHPVHRPHNGLDTLGADSLDLDHAPGAKRRSLIVTLRNAP